MFRRIIIATVIASMLLASCQPGRAEEVSGKIDAKGGAVVAHPSGLTIYIPPAGLYQDSDISITEVDLPAAVDEQTFVLPDKKAYEIQVSGEGSFAHPVEIAIPYDPSLLPANMVEAGIFPVYLYEGTWYRLEGTVDQENNVVRLLTVHNGFWSWAVDTIVENITGDTRTFFCEEGEDLGTVEEARAEFERRHRELLQTLQRTQLKMEEIEDPKVAEDVAMFLVGQETQFIVSNELARVAELGGHDVILTIGGRRIGMWLGNISTAMNVVGVAINGIQLFVRASELGDALFQVTDLLNAYRRWREAKAIVFALENGCLVTNMYPEDASALGKYYAALQEQTASFRPPALDLGMSAYPAPSHVAQTAGEENIVAITDLRTALDQALKAAGTGTEKDWLPLTDPDLSYEERLEQAEGLAGSLKPYRMSCLGYGDGPVGNFVDGIVVLLRAQSATQDWIFRFTLGHPQDSPVVRYAPYFKPWQEWNQAYWEQVHDQGHACPGAEQLGAAPTASPMGEIVILSPVPGEEIGPYYEYVGTGTGEVVWMLGERGAPLTPQENLLVWEAYPGADEYLIESRIPGSQGELVCSRTEITTGDCEDGSCTRFLELCEPTCNENSIVVVSALRNDQAIGEGRVTVTTYHEERSLRLCDVNRCGNWCPEQASPASQPTLTPTAPSAATGQGPYKCPTTGTPRNTRFAHPLRLWPDLETALDNAYYSSYGTADVPADKWITILEDVCFGVSGEDPEKVCWKFGSHVEYEGLLGWFVDDLCIPK